MRRGVIDSLQGKEGLGLMLAAALFAILIFGIAILPIAIIGLGLYYIFKK